MKPIRCYTCGKILGNKWICIGKYLQDKIPLKEIYEKIGIRRYCCKRIILTSVDDSILDTYILGDNIKIHNKSTQPNFLKVT